MNTTTIIQPTRSRERGHVNAGEMLLRILGVLLVAYLAFFCYVAAHEWAGHVLADSLTFASHGTTIARLEVIVQWLTVNLQDGKWSVGLAPFRIGGEVVSAIYREPFTMTDWEIGFGTLMGSGITTLISLIALAALNLRKGVSRFPWFAGAFVLYSVIFDQILLTFTGANADALVGAVLMGANPVFFKGLVIGLVVLQGLLLVRVVLRYRRGRQAASLLA